MKLKRKFLEKSKKIALERIDALMNFAEEEAKRNRWDRAEKYVKLSRKIAMKMRMPFPKKWKIRICKRCHAFLIFGKNARVRIKSKRYPHIVITCLNCGNIVRIPMTREKRARKSASNNHHHEK
ncbi:MAG: ribonuclease protein subunit [Methanothermococcus sp.]|jgi:ribonuclease P protein subunit RPR2|uniref:ribonuclease P protein component 4 n=1 Tax=Methanothermococcus TaxID=155862 RepID=UPI00037F5BFF|nr:MULTISPECIES: hypothetical protein [Methanothermococcus]MDK2790550.1 ribonuclease protein subunit [Methanothermococcus sp.]MDK2988113.1 ribonuclease protein subunit [Methanothermococcus sp.]